MLLELQTNATGQNLLALGLASSLLMLFAYCIYQRFLSPLAKYPGPFWASLTDVWYAYQSAQVDLHRRLIHLHEKYGEIVRVKPNKLSIASPEGFKVIYSAGHNFVKGEMYSPFKGKRPFDLFAEPNEQIHGQQRRLVSRAYTMDTMKSLEPYVDTTINVFLDKLEEIGSKGQTIDFAYLIQLFAFDVIGEVSFARRFGYIDAVSDSGIFARIAAALSSGAWVGEVPWVYRLHQRLVAPCFGNLLAVTARNGALHDFTVRQVAARQDRAAAAAGDDDHAGDVLSKLLAAHRAKPALTEVDVGFMLTSNVVAGSDTTSASLSSIVYHLLRTPAALERLLEELREKVRSGEVDGEGVVTQAQAERWPYLQAAILEGMRLHPAVGGLMARVVPEEGLRFEGHFVPGGYEVGTSPWVLHRNKSIYGEDAEDFRPDRWLDEEKKHDMHRYSFVFGGGSRTCIGKNIAMLEMSKVLPTLFMHFDIRLADPNKLPQESFM
ncbi:cytochrome p450 family protein [Neofusicoccum parvum]|nr:cytochrome p450 family protein [Neofusicoccum parvum]